MKNTFELAVPTERVIEPKPLLAFFTVMPVRLPHERAWIHVTSLRGFSKVTDLSRECVLRYRLVDTRLF